MYLWRFLIFLVDHKDPWMTTPKMRNFQIFYVLEIFVNFSIDIVD